MDTVPYYTWYISKFGMKGFENLYTKWRTPRKFGIHDLEEMIEKFKKDIELLESDFTIGYSVEELPDFIFNKQP